MNNFFITRDIVHYDSITKEKTTIKMYYTGIDEDTFNVHWTSEKEKAKFFPSYDIASTVAAEFGNCVNVENNDKNHWKYLK